MKNYILSKAVLKWSRGTNGPKDKSCVAVTCWCEREYVAVPIEVFNRGETVSCGHKECHG